MSSYDIERSKRESEEIRKVFREMFPLANEDDLPWAVCHIKAFLRDRIKLEVEQGTFHFTSRVTRVLCEVSPPKTHVEDMARIVVAQAQVVPGLREQLARAREAIRDDDNIECLTRIGSLYGIRFVASHEGRAWIVKQFEERVAKTPKATSE